VCSGLNADMEFEEVQIRVRVWAVAVAVEAWKPEGPSTQEQAVMEKRATLLRMASISRRKKVVRSNRALISYHSWLSHPTTIVYTEEDGKTVYFSTTISPGTRAHQFFEY
jgi:hypothetical protein